MRPHRTRPASPDRPPLDGSLACRAQGCHELPERRQSGRRQRGTLRGHDLIAVSARKKLKTRKVVLTVGSARSRTLVAGRSKVVEISLNGRGERLLASRHTLEVTLDVIQALSGGRSRALSQTVTFKAPKHKKRHH